MEFSLADYRRRFCNGILRETWEAMLGFDAAALR
jgi:hypothetical protein